MYIARDQPEVTGKWKLMTYDTVFANILQEPIRVGRTGVTFYSILPDNSIAYIMGHKVLCNKKYCDYWSDFGGGCKYKKNETPIDCLSRELIEETGTTFIHNNEDLHKLLKQSSTIIFGKYGSITSTDIQCAINIPYNENINKQFTKTDEISEIAYKKFIEDRYVDTYNKQNYMLYFYHKF